MSYNDGPYDFEAYDHDDDVDDLVICEACGAEVYALGDRCPKCGHWMVDDEGTEKLDILRPHRNTKLIAACLLILLAVFVIFGWIMPLFA